MKTKLISVFGALMLALSAVMFPAAAMAQQGLPVKQVWAEQYNNWSFQSQQANTYTFAGTNCNSFALVDGSAPSYFVFGNPGTSVGWPVLITDATPANSEIVTPTTLSTTTGSCGFSASPSNQHISFIVSSGTAGLQDAVGTLSQSSTHAINVLLDRTWYQLVAALPGTPSVYSIISALKGGSTSVNVVDTTTAPWTYWTWNGSNYVNNGGAVLPTVTLGTGAGTTPGAVTITGRGSDGTVTFKTGSSPTASATIFTLTWPTIANGGYNHTPACTVVGSYTVGTVTYGGSNPETAVVPATGTALTASTAYTFFYSCR
jgi:hypothetical protein